ncbi:ATP-binding cassette domain-containing protein [Ochrobactrum teleogrylli]|uniref:ATP-binding cassette domain-containing protein n=1 Tax=Ochrobactrum teleogrylli TaxID=2479765 RepID=UPI00384D5808
MNGPILEARNIMKSFGGVKAVDDVSIKVESSTINCIIGPNGAGKSTLFNVLCGALPATSGQILFRGDDITKLPLHRFARIGISRKFQVPSVFSSLSVEDNLLVAASATDSSARERVGALLCTLDLAAERHRKAGLLAHGQKQWLEIGMAMMIEPVLLLLDEPTAGMTPTETARTAALLKTLSSNVTILAIEHDMRFVRDLGGLTHVMHQGKLLMSGRVEEIEGDQLVRDIYLGRQ